MSGGRPPTKTFLEYRSSESSDFGEVFRDEHKDGTVWSMEQNNMSIHYTCKYEKHFIRKIPFPVVEILFP